MSRFFISTDHVDKEQQKIRIAGEDVRHIRNVLRCVPGDVLELSDGCGTDYTARVEELDKDFITTGIVSARPNKTEPPVFVTLYQGIPKADKMEYIIQKCIELGVGKIVPVITSRTVVRFDNARDAASKTARWQRIALEAAKQCDRGIVPVVEEPVRYEEALKHAGDSMLKLLPYEEETDGSLRRCLESVKNRREEKLPVAVFIGPEGGFEASEVQKAVACGFSSVSLGPRILRTETAGVAVLSIIMYELGDMAEE